MPSGCLPVSPAPPVQPCPPSCPSLPHSHTPTPLKPIYPQDQTLRHCRSLLPSPCSIILFSHLTAVQQSSRRLADHLLPAGPVPGHNRRRRRPRAGPADTALAARAAHCRRRRQPANRGDGRGVPAGGALSCHRSRGQQRQRARRAPARRVRGAAGAVGRLGLRPRRWVGR